MRSLAHLFKRVARALNMEFPVAIVESILIPVATADFQDQMLRVADSERGHADEIKNEMTHTMPARSSHRFCVARNTSQAISASVKYIWMAKVLGFNSDGANYMSRNGFRDRFPDHAGRASKQGCAFNAINQLLPRL